MATRGYEGTNRILYPQLAFGKPKPRRGNQMSGAMAYRTNDMKRITETGPTGPNVVSSDKRLASAPGSTVKTAAQRTSEETTNTAANMKKNATTQANKYMAGVKSGTQAWSMADFGKKSAQWAKMGYTG